LHQTLFSKTGGLPLLGKMRVIPNPTPFIEYAPSKNIFHIPSTSLVDLTKGSMSVKDYLYSSLTMRMKKPRYSLKT